MTSKISQSLLYLENLEHAASQLRSAYQEELKPLRVTPAEASVLLIIGASQTPPSLNAVSKQLPSDTPPSRLMSRLRDVGLVQETRDAQDKRVWRFALTADGRRRATQIKAIRRRLAKVVGDTATQTQLQGANRLLSTVDWS